MKSRAKAGSPELVYSNLIKFHVITTEPILMKCGHFGLMGYAYEEGCIGYIYLNILWSLLRSDSETVIV